MVYYSRHHDIVNRNVVAYLYVELHLAYICLHPYRDWPSSGVLHGNDLQDAMKEAENAHPSAHPSLFPIYLVGSILLLFILCFSWLLSFKVLFNVLVIDLPSMISHILIDISLFSIYFSIKCMIIVQRTGRDPKE